MPAISPRSTPIDRASALPLRAGRHLRPRRDRSRARRGRARRDHASCRREPCRSLDHRPGRLHRRPISSARYTLLEAARAYWRGLPEPRAAELPLPPRLDRRGLRQRSGPSGFFTETTPYDPRSPYSASKAASDHLVRAWHDTYGLPAVITNCSNNYGPYHFPEKLIPLVHPQRARGQAAAGLRRRQATCATGSMSRTMPAR